MAVDLVDSHSIVWHLQIAPLAAEQPAKPGDDGREVRQPLDSAQHSGMQPDVAPEASHPPKRSRRAAPKSTAGMLLYEPSYIRGRYDAEQALALRGVRPSVDAVS